MNRKWFSFLAVPALAAGMAFAQSTAPAPENSSPSEQPAPAQRGPRAFHRGWRADRIAKFLNLTDSQKAQVKSIMEEARETAKPVRDQFHTVRQQMMDAVKANDQARIQQLASTQGQLFAQLQTIRNDAFAKVYNTVLTTEQRNKADQLPAMFQNHMRGRKAQNRSNG